MVVSINPPTIDLPGLQKKKLRGFYFLHSSLILKEEMWWVEALP